MRLARIGTTLALLSMPGACTDPPTSADVPSDVSFINNGTETGSKLYPSVGAVLVDWQEPFGTINGDDGWCTGSLISPTVFLTAAHCVVGSYTPPGTQFYVSFAPDLYAGTAKFIKATGYEADSRYGHDQANLHDIAVIFLPSASTKGMTPLNLPKEGALDALNVAGALNDTLFVNVGYGVVASATGKPTFTYDGTRKWSYSEFMALQPTWLGLLMNTFATGEGGDCYGDSGSPKLLKDAPNTIYATVTSGDYTCRATTWDWRLDTPGARSFLGKHVKLP